MNFRHEVNRSQMETFVIDDVLYLMALGLFEKGCQEVIRNDLNFGVIEKNCQQEATYHNNARVSTQPIH